MESNTLFMSPASAGLLRSVNRRNKMVNSNLVNRLDRPPRKPRKKVEVVKPVIKTRVVRYRQRPKKIQGVVDLIKKTSMLDPLEAKKQVIFLMRQNKVSSQTIFGDVGIDSRIRRRLRTLLQS